MAEQGWWPAALQPRPPPPPPPSLPAGLRPSWPGCGELPPNAARASPAVPLERTSASASPQVADWGGCAGAAALPQQTLLAAQC